MGLILALIALLLEVVYWAITRDVSLIFSALVLVTLAVILGGGWPAFARRV